MFATMAPSPDSFVLQQLSSPPLDAIIRLQSTNLDSKTSGLVSASLIFRQIIIVDKLFRATSQRMSVSLWDWPLASADGLLTNEECSLLLETDLLNNDNDLLKTFPSAATKIESGEFFLHDDVSSLYPPSPPEAKPSRSELASDLLQQLENQCKQENIFSNWLEEKVDLPIFENIPQAAEACPPPPAYALGATAPQPTEELLREFETVYGAVELTHLTPPQSPPGPATQLLLSYAQQAQCPAEPWAAPLLLSAPAELVDHELQEVEELVRHRAAQLSPAAAPPSSDSGSPRSSPSSSPRSSTDEEWALPSRPKPYAREDRRSRKKEQNKNAATRYRQKKKAEIEVLLSEEQQLRQRHGELDSKCADLQREIRYLKSLMRDLFKAKGLIK